MKHVHLYEAFINEQFKDATIKQKVINFLKANPTPSDDEVHALASKLNIDTDDLESMIYVLAGKYVKKQY